MLMMIPKTKRPSAKPSGPLVLTSITQIPIMNKLAKISIMPLSVTLKDLLIFLFYLMWLVLCCGKNHFQNVEYSGRRSNPNTIQDNIVYIKATAKYRLQQLDPQSYDIMAVYSPSDVKALSENFDVESLPAIAAFGEATLRAATAAGMHVKANAPTPAAPSMAKALDIFCNNIANGVDLDDVEHKENADREEFIRAQQSKLAKKSRTRHTPTTTKKQ